MRPFLMLAAATTSFTGILDRFGVLAVFLFVLFENLGIPIPGETMLVAASAYAAAGHINIVWVVIFCIIGVWSGATLSYLAGQRGGVAFLQRLHVSAHNLERAQAYMTRWGAYTVTFGRYVAFLRSYIGWLAGINKMPLVPFLLWNFVGATMWTITFATLGFVLGHNWALIEKIFKTLGYGAVALVVVAIVAYIVFRRRRAAHADAAAGASASASSTGAEQSREEILSGKE